MSVGGERVLRSKCGNRMKTRVLILFCVRVSKYKSPISCDTLRRLKRNSHPVIAKAKAKSFENRLDLFHVQNSYPA